MYLDAENVGNSTFNVAVLLLVTAQLNNKTKADERNIYL